jgi:hypothetical protein
LEIKAGFVILLKEGAMNTTSVSVYDYEKFAPSTGMGVQ